MSTRTRTPGTERPHAMQRPRKPAPPTAPAARHVPPAFALPDQPFVEGAADQIDPDLRHRLISEAAYRRYAERNYADGYDLDDWLQAEVDIDHLLLGADHETSSR